MGEFHGFWIMIEETFPFAIRLPTFYSISICLATISPKDPLTYLLLLKPHPFWLIVAVPTTSADASLPSPRVKFSFPSQPTDTVGILLTIKLMSWKVFYSLSRLIELFHLVCCSKDTYQRLTVFGYADIIILRVAGARFGG